MMIRTVNTTGQNMKAAVAHGFTADVFACAKIVNDRSINEKTIFANKGYQHDIN